MISRAFDGNVSRCSIDLAFRPDDDDDGNDDHVDDIDGVGVTIQTATFETMAHRELLFPRKEKKEEEEENSSSSSSARRHSACFRLAD